MAVERRGEQAGGGTRPIVRKQRADGWTAEKRAHFLAELSATANVSASCRAVGKQECGMRALYRRDANFRAAYDAALSEAYAKLESMLLNRAIEGEDKPVRYQGKVVDRMTVYSNPLGLRLLQAHQQRVEAARAAAAMDSMEALKERIERRLSALNRQLGGDG